MKKTILLIDDEGIITKTVGNLLNREGYEIETANNGLNAIEKVKNKNFDLIIADIKMPHMDGIETVESIKKYQKNNNNKNIPVIFITGYADSDSHIKAKQYGEVVFKPFDMKEFLTTIAKVLNNK